MYQLKETIFRNRLYVSQTATRFGLYINLRNFQAHTITKAHNEKGNVYVRVLIKIT